MSDLSDFSNSDYDEESSIETDYEEEEQDEEQQETPVEETNFRLNAKKVFLTLSRVPNTMTHEDIKDRYIDTSVFQYIIARELHSVETDSSAEEDSETDDEQFDMEQDYIDELHSCSESSEEDPISPTSTQGSLIEEEQQDFEGRDIHYHIILEYHHKVDIRDCHYYDFEYTKDDGNIIVLHPSIEPVRQYRNLKAYCMKDNDYIHNYDNIKEEVLKCQDKHTLMNWLYNNNQLHYRQFWLDFWTTGKPKENIDLDEIPEAEYFKELPEPDYQYGYNTHEKNNRRKALFLWGKEGTGKSLYHYWKFRDINDKIICTEPKQLAQHYRGQKVIILEDITNFKEWSLGFLKSLITDKLCYTNSYYGSKLINKDRIIIITSNYNPDDMLGMDDALRSRLYTYNVPDTLSLCQGSLETSEPSEPIDIEDNNDLENNFEKNSNSQNPNFTIKFS